jgi:hypothetical protein
MRLALLVLAPHLAPSCAARRAARRVELRAGEWRGRCGGDAGRAADERFAERGRQHFNADNVDPGDDGVWERQRNVRVAAVDHALAVTQKLDHGRRRRVDVAADESRVRNVCGLGVETDTVAGKRDFENSAVRVPHFA